MTSLCDWVLPNWSPLSRSVALLSPVYLHSPIHERNTSMTPAILRLVHLRRQALGASIAPATLLNARSPHCWGDFAGQPLRPSVHHRLRGSPIVDPLRVLRKSKCARSRSHQRLQFWLTEAVCHIHPPLAQSPPSLSGTVSRPQYQCPLPRRNRGRAVLPLAWRSVPTALVRVGSYPTRHLATLRES